MFDIETRKGPHSIIHDLTRVIVEEPPPTPQVGPRWGLKGEVPSPFRKPEGLVSEGYSFIVISHLS